MLKLTLFIAVVFLNFGCASSRPYRPEPGTLGHFLRKSNIEIMQESMSKMPKNMVSDDTILVEIYDENGNYKGVAVGR